MRRLTEYILRHLSAAYVVTGLALGALLWLLEALQFLERGVTGMMDLVGVVVAALQIVPEGLIDLLPVIAVLATAGTLGGLQARSELTVMRAAGISVWRLSLVALMPGALLALAALAALQWVTPVIQQGPERLFGASLGENGLWHPSHGLWVRQEREFLNVADLHLGRIPTGINLYRFAESGALETHVQADSAVVHSDGSWRLDGVRVRHFVNATDPPLVELDTLAWDSFLPVRQLELLLSPPASLALTDLWAYVAGLKQRGQEYAEVNMMLWRRLALPLACLAMVLVAVASTAVPLKSRAVSVRLVVALTLGLGYQLLAELAMYLGLLLAWPALAVAIGPPLTVTLAAVWLLARTR